MPIPSRAPDPVADGIAEMLAHRADQLDPRTEVEVAADVIWLLVDRKVIKVDQVPAALAAVGLRMSDLRDAERRGQAKWMRPRLVPVPGTGDVPRPDPPPAAPDSARDFMPADMPAAEPEPEPAPPPARPQGGAAASPAGRKRMGHNSRQPKTGQDTMTCPKCGNDLSIEENFSKRADRPNSYWTVCDGCRREAGRDRYLSVKKKAAMNMANITFVLSAHEDEVGLACLDCGGALGPGDHVEGNAQLRHTVCPT